MIENTTRYKAAGGFIASSTLNIERCQFERNYAIAPTGGGQLGISTGGGLHIAGCSGTIKNCLFKDNVATYGSTFNLFNKEVDVVNCSIINASIRTYDMVRWGDDPPMFKNCIFYGQSKIFQGRSANVTYSNVEGGYPGEGNIDSDPLFVDFENGDYHLQRGSPCIEAGTVTGLTTDFDGNPRPIGLYDMGAFEFPFLRSDINGDERVDEMDLLLFQEDWRKQPRP